MYNVCINCVFKVLEDHAGEMMWGVRVTKLAGAKVRKFKSHSSYGCRTAREVGGDAEANEHISYSTFPHNGYVLLGRM